MGVSTDSLDNENNTFAQYFRDQLLLNFFFNNVNRCTALLMDTTIFFQRKSDRLANKDLPKEHPDGKDFESLLQQYSIPVSYRKQYFDCILPVEVVQKRKHKNGTCGWCAFSESAPEFMFVHQLLWKHLPNVPNVSNLLITQL